MLTLGSSETVPLRILPHASYSAVHTASTFALCGNRRVEMVELIINQVRLRFELLLVFGWDFSSGSVSGS